MNFSEIRHDYIWGPAVENGANGDHDLLAAVSIDAWKSADDNEEGEVLANVLLTAHGDMIVDFHDMKIEDDHIVDIIQGRSTTLSAEVQEVVFATVRSYANGILDKLRELQVDLRANPAIFIGGGSILFQNFIEESSQVAQADFVLDSKANAIGYGMLATAQLRRMTQQNHGGEFFAEG